MSKVLNGLPDELLARLRVGDRPSLNGVDVDALLDAAKVLEIIPAHSLYFPAHGLDRRNMTIDRLDRHYPGWRGYAVPETEGKRSQ